MSSPLNFEGCLPPLYSMNSRFRCRYALSVLRLKWRFLIGYRVSLRNSVTVHGLPEAESPIAGFYLVPRPNLSVYSYFPVHGILAGSYRLTLGYNAGD